ncbi:MAG: chromosomal replication initiator protein DnaA [Clostridium sp.]|nr:chromosomal replication initiator protein DnaA [Clostridium sp.]
MHLISEKWEEIKEYIKTEYSLNPVSYNTWILPLKFKEIIDNKVYILIPSENSQALKYIDNKYKKVFQVAISEMFDGSYDIVFVLESSKEENYVDNYENITSNINYKIANLNPKYKFETFVIGSNNKIAHSAALAVAESPGEIYNPLYIYGGAGLGKTHLMHSIGHFTLESKPDTKVIYVTSEDFTNDVIESIRSGNQSTISKMRDKYRTADVLMVDDIQFIIGKDATQEEFFNTFNTLHLAGKQIILSSDKPPKELETLDERFKSRFGMGLIVDIQAPDYETRMAILRQLAENNSKDIDDDIIKYIAENVKSNIRELEGAFNQIINISRIENSDYITLETAEKALRNIVNQNNNNNITPDFILDVVCEEFKVSPEDIKSSRRNQELVVPRHVFMYLCRVIIDMTYEEIAKYLLRKDHTTVMHGYRKIKDDMSNNIEFENKVNFIKNKINPQT